MSHKNDAVIRAMLDGKVVQYRYTDLEGAAWSDYEVGVVYPNILDNEGEEEWRIKPTPRVLWVVFNGTEFQGACTSRMAAYTTVTAAKHRAGYDVVKMQEVEDETT